MSGNQKRKKDPTKPANTSTGSSAPSSSKGNATATKTARKDSTGSMEKNAPNKGQNFPDFENFDKKTKEILFDRTLWIAMNLVGKLVEVYTVNDGVYEGILHTISGDRGMGVALRMARKKEKDGSYGQKYFEIFVIHPNEFIQMIAKEVSIDTRVKSDREFVTDTDISGFGTNLRERELQPWMPSGDAGGEELESFSFDGPAANRDRKNWDQFAANRSLFGVESTWDENHYTIPLDRKSTQYKAKAGEAARIADEIERGITSNPHLAEERGQALTGSDEIDEEDRYSSVLRDQSSITLESKSKSPRDSNNNNNNSRPHGTKYIPPHQRSGSNPPPVENLEKPEEKKEVPAPGTESKPVAVVPKAKGSQLRRYDSLHDASSTGHHHNVSSLSLRASADHAGQMSQISPSRSPLPSPELLVTERLRLRSSLVEERFKNKAPLPSDQFNTPHRSPLMSPLVNNVTALNALSLHPATPQLDPDVVRDFLNFSLTQKTNRSTEEKKKTIDNLKDFSKSLEKKVENKSTSTESKAPSKDSKASEKKTPSGSEGKKEVSKPKEENKKPAIKSSDNKTETKKEAVKASEPAKAKEEPKSDNKTAEKAKTSESKSETKPTEKPAEKPAEKSEEKEKSKLNPTAKPFKPMSASAAAFVPGGAPSSSVSLAPPMAVPMGFPVYGMEAGYPYDPNMPYYPPEGFPAGRGQPYPYPYPPQYGGMQPPFPPGNFPPQRGFAPYAAPFVPGQSGPAGGSGPQFSPGQKGFNPNAGGFVPSGRGGPMGAPFYPPSYPPIPGGYHENEIPEGN